MILIPLLGLQLAHSALWFESKMQIPDTHKLITNTVVAVIDTGLDTSHPALKDSLWTNIGESGFDKNGRNKSNNQIDDDKNGYVDDVHGWNFAKNNSDIRDDHGHGTHVSGLIAAHSDQFSGVARGAKIMILKYFDPKAPASGNLMNSVRAIKYASLMGAHLINYSGGGMEPFEPERLALLEVAKKEILVVAAAGNEQTNSDLIQFYPASYKLKNIISVAAIGPQGARVPSSNWGPQGVHISAPGENILSTYPGQKMVEMTGTSQATALVTAVLCHLRESRHNNFKSEELVKILIGSSVFNKKLIGLNHNPTEVSLKRAMSMKESDEDETLLSNKTAELAFP